MSSCLVLQAKDKLYIGADTSSSVFINNKLYRLNNNTKKLYLLNGNTVLYCAGNNSIAEKVVQHISSIYCRNDFSLISLKNWLIEMYPYKNKDKTVYDVEILIATFKNNRTIVYQMSQYKNYDIVSFEVSDAGVQILSAGIKNAECMSFAENELLNKSGVKSIFRTTFNNLSCNYIGGCLDLYEITKNGAVKIFDNEKINEHGIQYVHDVFNDLSVSLNAEVLVSKLVMSENLWLENNSGNYKFDDNGFTATSGKNTIKIQPNNSGELFSIYKGSNKQVYINSSGDVEFAGTLKSASGQFSGLLSGGSINIGNGTFTVDQNGNMYASSGTFTGTIYCSSGTIGGWTIGTNSLYANATSTSLGVFDSVLMPGQLSFKNYSDQKTLIINPVNIAWDNGGLTKITESSITTTDLSTTDLSFVRGSNPKITWTGQLSFATDLNVHFSKTPYVDNSSDGYNGYVAKSSWVKDKFALKSSLSDYLTKSYASTLYAPKKHSHSYTTKSEVESIVRKLVKSSALK